MYCRYEALTKTAADGFGFPIYSFSRCIMTAFVTANAKPTLEFTLARFKAL
jgi:hypothetical protein